MRGVAIWTELHVGRYAVLCGLVGLYREGAELFTAGGALQGGVYEGTWFCMGALCRVYPLPGLGAFPGGKRLCKAGRKWIPLKLGGTGVGEIA